MHCPRLAGVRSALQLVACALLSAWIALQPAHAAYEPPVTDRAKVLLDEQPELRELSKVDRAKAFKMALKLAGKELRGGSE